jgi:hypothetical protein
MPGVVVQILTRAHRSPVLAATGPECGRIGRSGRHHLPGYAWGPTGLVALPDGWQARAVG